MNTAQEAAVRDRLKMIQDNVYSGQMIPEAEGGFIFRQISLATGLHEREISGLARREGIWAYTARKVEDAYSARNFPRCGIDAFVSDPYAAFN